MRSTTPTAKPPSSERLTETDSKEFVFEETTLTSSLLISSASRFILVFQLRLLQNFQTSEGGQAVNGFILSDLERECNHFH